MLFYPCVNNVQALLNFCRNWRGRRKMISASSESLLISCILNCYYLSFWACVTVRSLLNDSIWVFLIVELFKKTLFLSNDIVSCFPAEKEKELSGCYIVLQILFNQCSVIIQKLLLFKIQWPPFKWLVSCKYDSQCENDFEIFFYYKAVPTVLACLEGYSPFI